FGNQHRGCGHFVVSYYSGVTIDCNRADCKLSSAHKHTAQNCGCPSIWYDHRRVQNLIQEPCDECKSAALAARVTRRW
ncbi:hypothetical protein DAEQUDRAFT_662869, partial [Daedalea quercina L-15889]